jgi:hypothetical protein
MATREIPAEVDVLPRTIPDPHKEVFGAIDHAVSWLHAVWRTFHQLFFDKETVDLLNRAAPAAARIIQDALIDDVLLSLSRLTDPAVSGKGSKQLRPNLTLEQLRPLAEATGSSKVSEHLDKALKELQDSCWALRAHRNKRIAHSDLGVALEKDILPFFSWQGIEHALATLRDAMNAINVHYRLGPTIYEKVATQGDGDALLGVLRDGLRLREIRRHLREMNSDALRTEIMKRRPTQS